MRTARGSCSDDTLGITVGRKSSVNDLGGLSSESFALLLKSTVLWSLFYGFWL